MSKQFSIFVAALVIAFVWIGTCFNKAGSRLLAMDVEDGETYYELCNDAYENAYNNFTTTAHANVAAEAASPPTDVNNHPNTHEREELGGVRPNHPAGFNNPNEAINEPAELAAYMDGTALSAAMSDASNAEDFVEGLGGPLYEERKHTHDGDGISMPNPAAEWEQGN